MTVGVILAGGLARRMGGGDKPRVVIGGQTVLARTIAVIAPQVTHLAINANGDPARFADTGLPILPDSLPGHLGPLAGILVGLDWAAALGAEYLLSVPGDCPFLPTDLAARLQVARLQAAHLNTPAPFACATSGGRAHPVAALWPTALAGDLRHALLAGERKIDAYTARHLLATADWPVTPVDPFFNVNTPEDAATARGMLMP